MSVSDLVIATGTGTLVGGTLTVVNPRIPVGAICIVSKSQNLPAAVAFTSVVLEADNTVAGQITFNSYSAAAGALVAADVSTISYVILQPNFVSFQSS
jgi:hypothetical protein